MSLWWKIQIFVLVKLIFISISFTNYAVGAVSASEGLDIKWVYIGSTMADLKSLRQGSSSDDTTTAVAGQGTTGHGETYPPLLYISYYPIRRQNNTLEAKEATALAKILILPVNDPERIKALRTLGKRPRIGNMLYDWIKDLNDTKLRTIDPRFTSTMTPNTLPPQVNQELSSKINSGWNVYDYKDPNWDAMKKIQENMKSKSTAAPILTTEVTQVTLFKPDPPIVAKARAVMAQHFVGYLSAFMSTLCEIVGTKKEGNPAVEIAQGASAVVTELSDGGHLNDIGQATRHALEDYINTLMVMKADQIDALTEKCTQMFRDHSYLENDTQVIIEDIESWYTMDEGEDLFATLVIVDGYPENKMSNVDVVRKVAAAILQPYYRIETYTNTKAYHTIMLIEAAVDKRTMYLRSKVNDALYSIKKPKLERIKPNQNAEQSKNKNNETLESNIRHVYSNTKASSNQENKYFSSDDVATNKEYDSGNNRNVFPNTRHVDNIPQKPLNKVQFEVDNIEYDNVDDRELSKAMRNNKNAKKTLKSLTTTAYPRFIKSQESTNVKIPIYGKSMYVQKLLY